MHGIKPHGKQHASIRMGSRKLDSGLDALHPRMLHHLLSRSASDARTWARCALAAERQGEACAPVPFTGRAHTRHFQRAGMGKALCISL